MIFSFQTELSIYVRRYVLATLISLNIVVRGISSIILERRSLASLNIKHSDYTRNIINRGISWHVASFITLSSGIGGDRLRMAWSSL